MDKHMPNPFLSISTTSALTSCNSISMTLRHMFIGWMKSQAHSTDSIHPMNMCLSVMEMELQEDEDDVVVIDKNGLAMFIQSTPDLCRLTCEPCNCIYLSFSIMHFSFRDNFSHAYDVSHNLPPRGR